MAVHNRHHLGAGAVDLAVDVALDEAFSLVAGQRLAVGVELHQVRRGDERGGERARHDEALGLAIAARADVAVGVEHFVHGEDAARGDEIVDELAAGGELGFHLCRNVLRTGEEMYSAATARIAAPARASDAPRGPRASESGPAMNAPMEMNAGLSISRLEMRPRIASGAEICSIAMLLEACAISAAPPITLKRIASTSVGLRATPMIEAAMTTIHAD